MCSVHRLSRVRGSATLYSCSSTRPSYPARIRIQHPTAQPSLSKSSLTTRCKNSLAFATAFFQIAGVLLLHEYTASWTASAAAHRRTVPAWVSSLNCCPLRVLLSSLDLSWLPVKPVPLATLRMLAARLGKAVSCSPIASSTDSEASSPRPLRASSRALASLFCSSRVSTYLARAYRIPRHACKALWIRASCSSYAAWPNSSSTDMTVRDRSAFLQFLEPLKQFASPQAEHCTGTERPSS